jgi:Xaa-Pro aminopeptidase
MSERIERLRALLEEPLLVTDDANILYFTGFHSSNAALLVEPTRVRLFTDFRYAGAARQVEGVELVETPRSLYRGLAERLDGAVGFEVNSLTVSRYDTLRAGGLELVPRAGLVERLRAVKDEDELQAIREAAEVTNSAYERISEERFIGRTELDLAWQMEQIFHELGAERLAFDIAMASGASGATPHHHADGRTIEAGETIVIDSGCIVRGYASDCTRTFCTGRLPDELQDAYRVCLAAQEAGVEAVRAGATGAAVDAVARTIVDESPFEGRFGHGLGHGVGLRVHESPTLRPESEDVLEPGNVVTVEPGIYLEGLGGIRIEDLVVVTGGEAEVLTTFPKGLVSVE